MNSDYQSINVAIRIRPLNDREKSEGQEERFMSLEGKNMVVQTGEDGEPLSSQAYTYHHVFDKSQNTEDVYNCVGSDLVEGVVNGINGTVFAYGQTSSGKTFTMLGAEGSPGILERAAADIFKQIAQTDGRDFLLRVSFVEIYNEMIRDLLSDNKHGQNEVAIREDPRRGVYSEAKEVIVTDFDTVISLLNKGISKRAVESTAMNDTSSRSHTLFKLVVESKARGDDNDGAVLVAALNLVDLAGSESVRHTGATGQRAKEGGKINQSLLSLSRVIHALSTPGMHVSFRDSKLTRLLQPSLSGNAKMSVVCCITAAEKYLEETRSTLQFAHRASMVKTQATVNEVLDDSAKIKRLERELRKLREQQDTNAGIDNNLNKSSNDDEKAALLAKLSELEAEREKASTQLNCLKELVSGSGVLSSEGSAFATTGNVVDPDASFDLGALRKSKAGTKRNRNRDTWCPGFSGDSGTIPSPRVMNDNNNVDTSGMGDLSTASAESASSAATVVLEAKVTQQQGVISELKQQLDSVSTTMSADKENELDSLRVALAAAESKLIELGNKKEELETLETQRNELQMYLEETQNTLTYKEDEVRELSTEILSRDEELAEKSAALLSLKIDKENLQNILKDVENDCKRQKHAENFVRGAELEMKENNEVINLQLFTLAQQLTAANAKIHAIEAEAKAAASAMSIEEAGIKEDNTRIESMQHSIHELSLRLHIATQSLAKQQTEMVSLQEDKQEEKIRCIDYQKRITLLEEENSTLDEMVTSMEQSEAEAAHRETELMSQIAILKESTEELGNVKESSNRLDNEMKTLRAQLEEISQDRDNLSCKLSEAEIQLENSKIKNNTLQKEYDNMATTVSAVTASNTDVDEWRQKYMNLEATNTELIERCTKADATAAELNAVLSKGREQRLNLEAKVEELTSSLRDAEDQLANAPTMPIEGLAASVGDSNLIQEMNTLMEQKCESDARAATAEENARKYREQLSEFDKSAAREQEELMAAAEAEMTNLQTALSAKDKALQEKEDTLASMKNKLFTLQQQTSASHNTIASDENVLDDTSTAKLRAIIADKDKRIAHLETTKLTKEQMAKIKTVKDERTKFYNESKALKKNLKELKKAYDELAASPAAILQSGPSYGAEDAVQQANELTSRLAQTKSELERTKSLVDSLKDKLKDCSKQLQEYEIERKGVVDILNNAGVDTTGLLPCDASMDESFGSMLGGEERDLCDAVRQLVTQHINALQDQSAQQNSLSAASGKLGATEARANELSNELSNIGSINSKLRQENEALKIELSDMRKEMTSIVHEKDHFFTKVNELQAALSDSENKASSASDHAQSELLALEEENLELMKENKELRVKVAGLSRGVTGTAAEKTVNIDSIAKIPPVSSSTTTLENNPIVNKAQAQVHLDSEEPGECNQS